MKELLKKYLLGNCSEKESNQVVAWIEDESYTFSGERIVKEVWDEYEAGKITDGQMIRYNRILDRIHHQINLSNTKIPIQGRLLRITSVAAEILLLPVLIIFLYSIFSNKGQHTKDISDLEISAPAGSKIHFALSDGTKVWLNHGSKLKFPNQFKDKNRKVFLTGEAYFEVAHLKEVPFIVGTNEIEIKATGTAFDVSAYPEDNTVETTLVNGQIIVYRSNSTSELKVLSPDESLKFNKRGNYSIEKGNIVKNTSWKDGLLVFRNDPLEEVAKKLARWYNVDVEIANKKVKEFTFTATFTDENLLQVLELMTLPTPVCYQLIPTKKLPDGNYLKQKVIIGLKNQR